MLMNPMYNEFKIGHMLNSKKLFFHCSESYKELVNESDTKYCLFGIIRWGYYFKFLDLAQSVKNEE